MDIIGRSYLLITSGSLRVNSTDKLYLSKERFDDHIVKENFIPSNTIKNKAVQDSSADTTVLILKYTLTKRN